MRIPKIVLLAALGVLVFALAGCGGSSQDNSTDNNPAQSEVDNTANAGKEAATQSTGSSKGLALAADPSGALKYDKTSLSGKAGNVTIEFTNDSSTPHNVTVTDSSNKKLGATEDVTGASAKLELKGLKAGSYTFFCSLPGHEQAGMKGKLTIN